MFTPADFRVDWQDNTATCPQGRTSMPGRTGANNGKPIVRFPFAAADCRPCPVRTRCTRSSDPDRPRTLAVPPREQHLLRQSATAAQTTDHWWQRYRARAGIEGTISQLVRAFGARRARYRGLDKTHVQHTLTAMACNLARLGDWYDPRPKTPRPGTRIHALCQAQGLAA